MGRRWGTAGPSSVTLAQHCAMVVLLSCICWNYFNIKLAERETLAGVCLVVGPVLVQRRNKESLASCVSSFTFASECWTLVPYWFGAGSLS